jgi:hypothetical protein
VLNRMHEVNRRFLLRSKSPTRATICPPLRRVMQPPVGSKPRNSQWCCHFGRLEIRNGFGMCALQRTLDITYLRIVIYQIEVRIVNALTILAACPMEYDFEESVGF